MGKLKVSLGKERDKYRVEWRRNCQLLIEYDDLLMKKDQEIAELRDRLWRSTAECGGGKGEEGVTSREETVPAIPATPPRVTAGGSPHTSPRGPASEGRKLPGAGREPPAGPAAGGAIKFDQRVRKHEGSPSPDATFRGVTQPHEGSTATST